jgi:hypothetical protein
LDVSFHTPLSFHPFSTYIELFIALNLLFVKKILIVTIEANFTSPLAGLKNAIKTDQNLAVTGGFVVPKIMRSRSTDLSGRFGGIERGEQEIYILPTFLGFQSCRLF